MKNGLSFADERTQLAAVLRLGVRHGWQSGICNHFSLAVDDRHVLINPQGFHWSEVKASDLLLIDGDGEVVEGDGYVEPSAFFIHYHIHRVAPSARCVLHAHPRFATAIACIDGGRVEYSHQDSLRFYDRIAYDDGFNGVAHDDDEGARIAHQLGNRSIMFMAHHGITVTGSSVALAYNDFYYLEKACEFQVTAQSTGKKLRVLDDDTCRRLAPGFQESEKQYADLLAAMMRILDREEPEYRN
jgi:ribulose-5-phosphate 4-epimerase/fuculose-1-phosphate aldolase